MKAYELRHKQIGIMKRLLLTLTLLCLSFASQALAENWDNVVSSGKYYYGIGVGRTQTEADQAALANLTNQIATYVSSDFTQIDDMTSADGKIDHKTRVLNCVRTYSQAGLTNTSVMTKGKEPELTVMRYVLRTELSRMFEARVAQAKDMIKMAQENLKRKNIDVALQYYYWAYALIRSVQYPLEVKDEEGHLLVNWLPDRIESILADIDVQFDKREGDYVDVLINYQGTPVSSLEFTYSDGRADCQGLAKDGRGMLEMVPGYETDAYHLSIECEYKNRAVGDVSMCSVLDVVPSRVFAKSNFVVRGKKGSGTPATLSRPAVRPNLAQGQSRPDTAGEQGIADGQGGNDTRLTEAQAEASTRVVGNVMDAIISKQYFSASSNFTTEGFNMFNKLISYGKGRIVGSPNVTFTKGSDGRTIARGLQMSFSFTTGKNRTKKTFVEDVVFTLDADYKIENVAFGLGKIAENDIIGRHTGFDAATREALTAFLENYKTAYCLERMDYINTVFSGDAVIIVGNVAKVRAGRPAAGGEKVMSTEGVNIINYNRYTKDQYLKNLARCFARNEFVNIRFTHNDIQPLDKYSDKKIFAIQIGQEYSSSTYSDKGFLFLLVDLTNPDEPIITVRTWQPNEVSMDKLFSAGDFYID